jgi:hypothetical protein
MNDRLAVASLFGGRPGAQCKQRDARARPGRGRGRRRARPRDWARGGARGQGPQRHQAAAGAGRLCAAGARVGSSLTTSGPSSSVCLPALVPDHGAGICLRSATTPKGPHHRPPLLTTPCCLLWQVLALGKPTVLVLVNGGALAIDELLGLQSPANINALVEAFK